MSKKTVTSDDIRHIATLSRLEFEESEIESYRQSLEDMVAYLDILNAVDTTKIKDFSRPIGVLREDKVAPSLSSEEVVKNAAQKTDTSFIVPRVVE